MEQNEKRKALLADRYLRQPRDKLYLPRTLDQIERSIRSARKYVLNEDACIKIANIVMAEPKLIVREHHLATPPFPVTWIEWPSWHYWMHMAKVLGQTRIHGFNDPETADYEVGFLIDHGRVNVISACKPDHPLGNKAQLTPVQYRLHSEWPIQDQLEFCKRTEVSRMGIDGWFWGSTWDDIDEGERRLLRGDTVAEFLPLNPKHRTYDAWMRDGSMIDFLRGSAGELRTIIALLLILNRRNITETSAAIPHARGFLRGKMITHSSHHRVQIKLDDPVPEFRNSVKTGTGVPLRAHERSGYFQQNQTAREYARIAGCLHEWIAADEKYQPLTSQQEAKDTRRWVCKACEGKQWFVDSYWTKGRPEGGIVIHDKYEVT